MSNKNSESETISVEHIRSSYPDISCLVNDNSTKVTEASKNDCVQQPVVQKVTVTPTKIPSTQTGTVKLNNTVTGNPKIPIVVGDRKVPPYVNALPQNPVRVQKAHPQKATPKVLPKPVTEKTIVTTDPATLTASVLNKIPSVELKKCVVPQAARTTVPQTQTKPSTPQMVRTSVSQTPSKPDNKPALIVDKNTVVSTSVTPDEMKSANTNENSNKNAVDKVSLMIQAKSPLTSRTSDAFGKNLQSNVLTLTSRPSSNSPSPKAIPSKDAKPNSTESTPRSVNTPTSILKNASPKQPVLSTESLCKNISKSVSVQCTETPPKQPPARIVAANNSPKNDTVAKTLSKATSSNDTGSKVAPSKITIAVTSTEASTKSDEKSSVAKNINSRSASPATTPSIAKTVSKSPTANSSTPSTPKTQTYAETFVVPSTPNHPNVPSHISNNKNVTLTLTPASGNLQLSSLSEVENNKDIREALNSGSTASFGEGVTISTTGSTVEYVVIQSVTPRSSEIKIRNVSNETTIETITKQPINSISSSSIRNKNGNSKNGNSNDSVGQSSKSESNSGASTPSNQSTSEVRTPKREAVSSTSHSSDESDSPNVKMPKKKMDEPVECLTISSDDEEPEPDHFVSSLSDTSDVSVSIMNKEPPIERDDDHVTDGESYEREVDALLEATSGESCTNLACRTVRIGSYKVVPRDNVTLSEYGLKIVVPPLNNSNDTVALKIPIHDIVKVLVHFNRSLPVIFYYVTAQAGARVRNLLKMTDSSNCYFDPASDEESHRRITLLPEKFTDANKINISDLYLQRDVLDELTLSEANQLLVKSAPREVQKGLKQVPPNPVQTIMVFPPPPARGGISINTEDYSCLAEDVFLNDVIIDFYLKYLFYQRLSDEDRQKTHIFSSFFYKRLTDKTTPVPAALQNAKSGDSASRAAEIRHHRVKTWTKNIDIFSKDYIVIPLNENQHWFLAIICFPGLKGPVKFSDNSPVDLNSSKKDSGQSENSTSGENVSSSSQTMTIGSTTITPLRIENSYTVCDDDTDAENRDEADGADEDVNNYTSSDDSDEDYSESEITESGEVKMKLKTNAEREPIKQPCILIFDSLAGASRARIIATLREYLRVEYKTKHGGEERDFSKNVVKGACPRVPQQTNYTDCGLYVLQYVESFFENKITDFHIPIKMLRYWFSPHTVSNKRYEIQQLLLQLMSEQNINVRSLHLPELHLSPPHHTDYDSDEMEEYGDDDELYDEEQYEYNELDEIEEHDARARASILEDDIDEGEYIDEDEIVEDDKYEYAIFDSADESQSEELSDDDIYKNLDLNVVEPPRPYRRTVYHVRTKSDGGEETIQEEEEEIEEDDDDDKDEQPFTDERLVNLSNENVTISRMPAGADLDGENSRRMAELKAARPLKKFHEVSLEKATEGTGSPAKKFRSN